MNVTIKLFELAALLKSYPFSVEQEKQTQADVEQFLTAQGIKYEREKRLSQHDIPDFFIDGIAIEVKTRCPRKAIFRQLTRYAKHDEVKGLILLTGTSMGLPLEIEGKPALVVSLGEAWL